jgi:hypothetical protein
MQTILLFTKSIGDFVRRLALYITTTVLTNHLLNDVTELSSQYAKQNYFLQSYQAGIPFESFTYNIQNTSKEDKQDNVS